MYPTRHLLLRRAFAAILAAAIIVGGVLPALAMPVSANAQTAENADAAVPLAWFELQRLLIRDTYGFSPPVAARALGYTGLTLYEAVVGGMPGYRSLAGQLNELDALPRPEQNAAYDWPTVANSALFTITRLLYPTATPNSVAALNALYARFAADSERALPAEVYQRSVRYGTAVAEAIFAYSTTDGGHEGFYRNSPLDYEPPTGAGLWVRTPRQKGSPAPALQPYWGDVRPFIPGSEECPVAPPIAYSEDPQSAFYREALEVYQAVNNLTPEQLEIARYWADDPRRSSTPAGHSFAIMTGVLREQKASLARAVEAYARLGIAVNDAFIGCWKAKYTYNLLRPITYIHKLIDAEWVPPLTTPPFPEYPSGHSVQSGAAAQVMADLFGEDYAFTDRTHDEAQFAPRSFASFAAFAEEAAISRLYGGIHYRAAIEAGLSQGKCIGVRVSKLQFRTAQ